MSPSTSCFSFATAAATSPRSTRPPPHWTLSAVAETTYLGRLFSLFAHASVRDSHRAANHSSLRLPSSRAWLLSASSSMIEPHALRSSPPWVRNQPPCLKPSLPSGSWTTPSSEMFVLMTIFPMAVSPCLTYAGCHWDGTRGTGKLGAGGAPSFRPCRCPPGDEVR